MSLSEAIKQTMNARDLSTAEVARRLGEGCDRATFYRLLSGATTEPRLGTLVGLCEVLEISPTELLQLAGLWPQRDRAPTHKTYACGAPSHGSSACRTRTSGAP